MLCLPETSGDYSKFRKATSSSGRTMSLQIRTHAATNRERSNSRQKNTVNPPSETSLSFTSRLATFHKVHMINDEPVSYQTTAPEYLVPLELRSSTQSSSSKERMVTRSENHTRSRNQTTLQLPQWLAQVGFYYTPLSIKHQYAVTCSSCNQIIRDPIPLEIDISTYHLAQNASCALSAVWKFRNIISESSNSNDKSWQEDAVFGNVKSEKGIRIRRETFKGWRHQFPDIDSMVLTGLYYDPYTDLKDRNGHSCGDDRVICMYCGLRLEQWEVEDDPVIVHQKEMPSCWVFNFDKTSLEDQIASDDKQERMMIEFDGADENLPEFEGVNDFQDDGREVELISSDKEDAPTVISLTTATTTTTNTALPVEILNQDEVEEFLDNSQGEQREENSKQVEIPSMKSSDLSQFFTELDAESESEVGASFFASNRRRREREKEQKQKNIGTVEPIAEESLISEKKDEDRDESIQQSSTQTERQHEKVCNDDFEKKNRISTHPESENDVEHEINKSKDLANAHDSELKQDSDLGQEPLIFDNDDFAFENIDAFDHVISHDRSENASKSPEKMAETELNMQTAENSTVEHYSNENEKEANEEMHKENVSQPVVEGDKTSNETSASGQSSTKPLASKEALLESQKTENNRVEQLETELKLLKMQIEALQNSQNLQIQTQKEQSPQIAGNSSTHDSIDSNSMTASCGTKNEDEHAPSQAISLEVSNVPCSPEMAKKGQDNETPSDVKINTASFIKQEEAEENREYRVNDKLMRRKKGKKIKLKHSKLKRNLPEKEQVEEQEIRGGDIGDIDSERQKEKEKKRKGDRIERTTQSAVSDDPLAFKIDSRKRSKKLEKTNRKRQKVAKPNKADVKQEPGTQLENYSIVLNKGNDKTSEPSVKIEQTPEIPTELDQFTGNSSVVNNREHVPDELLVSKDVLMNSEQNERLMSNSDEEKHEISPTLMRKKARTPPVTGTTLEEVQDPGYQTLDALMNAARVNKNKVTEAGENDQLFMENEIMMKNQSTPYADNVKTIAMTGNSPKNASDKVDPANNDSGCRRRLSLDEKTEATKWVPIDSSKYQEFYKDIQEATGYVKEVLDSKYELLGDDLEGLLTEFIAEIPPEQLKMTVREWIRFQEEQALGLVLDKAEDMMAQFRIDQSKAIRFLEGLPEKKL